MLWRDAAPGACNTYLYPVTLQDGLDDEVPACRHGICSVADNIEEHLLQTIRLHTDLRQIWLQHDAEGDLLALQRGCQQGLQAVDDRVHIHHFLRRTGR